jgi:hypothetical protein
MKFSGYARKEGGDLLKTTVWPSFHISVITVSPGYTIPANLFEQRGDF